jgi:putative MATE family efflux protein
MQATFTKGLIFKHICVMTFTSAAGLLVLFFVDLVDMFWLSLLGEVELAAAIGYAGSLLFFTMSVGIGLTIAASAVVSQSIGRGEQSKTKKLVANVMILVLAISFPISWIVLIGTSAFLNLIGAEGHAASLASQYIYIVLPSMPIMALGMALTGVLRAMGKAKESMYLTVVGGVVNAVLDPLFIFGLELGIQGAAIATVCSRFAMLAYGIYVVVYSHSFVERTKLKGLWPAWLDFRRVAVPSILTNLATPIGVVYVTFMMAGFGDGAVAGNAIISKVQPLAFCGLFALSGAVGPIVGQNLGAKMTGRILAVLNGTISFILLYCFAVCIVLALATELIVAMFSAAGDAAYLIRAFCWGLSSVFVFNGLTFCTNAIFNNLNVAHWATYFNFAKSTVFTIPFVHAGALLGGMVGVWIGLWIGSAIIAAIGLCFAYYRVKKVERELLLEQPLLN